MDFLKMLMLYMTMTMASTVQGAPLPEPTAVPTAAPTAIVETAAPQPDSVEAATPAPASQAPAGQPTATPAPATQVPAPEPTLTPNPAYRNQKQGDKGDRVKKLQQRLIELGYLEKGDADGAFGAKTRRAVLRFQEVNGLSKDGVAGDATQTHLFENPDVKPNPDAAIATTAPAAIAQPEDGSVPQTMTRELLPNASIVYGSSGEAMAYRVQQDGVTLLEKPRVFRLSDGTLQLPLSDLAACLEDWTLTMGEDGSAVLSAAGYTVTLTRQEGTYSCRVDEAEAALAAGDAVLEENEVYIAPAFLEKTLAAETEWDEEEQTLMLRIQPKAVAQATD